MLLFVEDTEDFIFVLGHFIDGVLVPLLKTCTFKSFDWDSDDTIA